MKIFLSDIELSAGAQTPRNLSIDLHRQSQTEFIIGAKNASVSDRGNGKYFVSFEIEKSHSSESDAKFFAFSHAAEVEKKLPSDLKFKIGSARSKARSFLMRNASCTKIRIVPSGMFTLIRYEFCSQTIEEENL